MQGCLRMALHAKSVNLPAPAFALHLFDTAQWFGGRMLLLQQCQRGLRQTLPIDAIAATRLEQDGQQRAGVRIAGRPSRRSRLQHKIRGQLERDLRHQRVDNGIRNHGRC